MFQKALGEETLIYTVFVPWKPISPNQLLHKHWTVTAKNSKAASKAWRSALLSSCFNEDQWTQITCKVRANLSGMP